MKPFFWREANCLAECATEMALIRKASAMGGLSQLRTVTQKPLGKIDPSVLQIAIRAGAKQCPEITRKLPTVTASHLLKLIESRPENDGGFEKVARPYHGCSVSEPISWHLASHVVHGLRQIVESIFISSRILDTRAVDNHVERCRDQSGTRRDAIEDKRQFRASNHCLNMSWRNISSPIAESRLIVAVAIVYFVGMEDQHLPWQRMSHRPAIVERLHP